MERLEQTLEKIKNATKGIGISSVSNQVERIADAADKLTSSGITKLSDLAGALTKLKNIGDVKISSSIGNQLGSIADAALKLQNADLTKITQLADSLRPLSTLDRAHLASYTNQLGKLPQVINDLHEADLDRFIAEVNKLNTALQPFGQTMEKISGGFAAFPSRIQRLIQSTERFNDTMSRANKVTSAGKTNGLWGFLNSAHSKYLLLAGALSWAGDKLGSFVERSAKYNENLNLFTVAMGKYAEEAYSYAQSVQAALGIDMSEWMRNQGIFMQIATGFGVIEEKAYTMSQGLTQIAYDIASFYNISTEEAMQKVQSGISGEIEPLRRLGYALDAATLQQIAYDHGIEQNINTMTQAQKSQLRYVAIMEQSSNAMGDMARTIMSPANALRVVSMQLEQLQRAMGNAILPLLMEILPYAQAAVMVLTDAINKLAVLFGFELPEIDYSSLGGLQSGAEDATGAIDETTDAVKALKNATLGIDELNVISPNEASGVDGNAFDLPLDINSYEFFDKEYENQIAGIADRIKEAFEPLVPFFEGFASVFEGIVSLFGGFYDGGFYDWLKTVGDWDRENPNTLYHIGQGIGVVAAAWLTLSAASGVTKFFSDIISSVTGLGDVVSGIAGAISGFYTPLLIVAGAIGALATGLGYVYATNEDVRNSLNEALNGAWKAFVDLCDNIVTNIIPTLSDGWNGLVQALTPIGEWLESVFTSIWKDMIIPALEYLSGTIIPNVKEVFSGLWNNILAPFGAFLLSVFTPAIEAVSSVLSLLWKDVAVPVADFIGGVFTAVWESAVKIFTERVVPTVETVIKVLQFLWDNVLSPVIYYVRDVWAPRFEAVFETISKIIEGFKTTLVGVIEFITGVYTRDWEYAWDGISKIFSGIWSIIVEIAKAQINAVIEKIKGFVNKVVDDWNWLKGQVGTRWQEIWSGASSYFMTFWNDSITNTQEFFNELVERISNAGRAIGTGLANVANWAIGGIEDIINGGIEGINKLIRGLNRISIDLPDWLGGGSFGFDIDALGKISIPRVKLPGYASGGYPDEGQLFIARERGAEMVGSIGGRTAVANNDQIVEAIRLAVYEAEMAARSQDSGGDTYVYLDSDRVAARVEKRRRESGVSIFSGGVVE